MPAGPPYVAGPSAFAAVRRVSQSRALGAALLLVVASCARVSVARGARHCPPGTTDYGSGMVAATLPEQPQAALIEARALALMAAGPVRSSFLATEPYRPHVSVIYGITEDKAPPALQALRAFVAGRYGATLTFGRLKYWDDANGQKTSLVVEVLEPMGLLHEMHDCLAQAAQIGATFAYHPHVTLAYLQLGARLPAGVELAISHRLEAAVWLANSFYLTTPCGVILAEVKTEAP